MKSPVKQKNSTLQSIINTAQTGGGGGTPVDAYTKAESDAKFETQTNASATYLSKSTAQSTYLAIADADEVPEVTSEDNGKILKATYSEGTGSYAWESAGGFTQVQANWNESDDTDPSYIQNKPTIPSAQVNSDWTANSGVAQILNKPDLSDMATKTWVGQQGYLTDADEVPTVTSDDDGKILKATYSSATGTGRYAWATPASGLQVETDGTNYWITVNSIRLYFASSAPTGTIPDGSLGIGW